MKIGKVTHIERNTPDCVLVSLAFAEDEKQDMTFAPGQYLTLCTDIDGNEVRRSYSLCSIMSDGIWRVGIKKLQGGLFSTFANDVLRVGDSLMVDTPKGKFVFPDKTSEINTAVFFAAGSGITPIFSIIKSLLHTSGNVNVKLFYSNKTVNSIILKEELEGLKNLFMNRLEIYYLLSRQSRNIPLLDGRLDEQKCNEISQANLLPLGPNNVYFMCGPEDMILGIDRFLKGKGIAKEQIHFELFFAGTKDVSKVKYQPKGDESKIAKITITEGGKTFNFDLEKGSHSILDAALLNHADLPYACKGGVCCTCRAKVEEGDIEMLLSYGLEDDEIAAGYVLTCQTFPMSDTVKINFDA